jgi:phospholipase/carboxylesterase
MNRIRHLTDPVQESYPATQVLKELSLPSAGSEGCEHASFVPLHYEPNYAYPLLVWLHGSGHDPRQLQSIVTGISVRNYVAVAPRGSWAEGGIDEDASPPCYQWRQTAEGIVEAEHRVWDCIEQSRRRFHIALNRVFLIGADDGGTMALRLAALRPQRFAGVISIGGRFPQGNTPLASLKEARGLQVLIEHGRHSSVYSENALCQDLRLLHVAGMSVTLRQYTCGDEITMQMLSDVNSWIMQQVTGVDAEASETDDCSSYKRN